MKTLNAEQAKERYEQYYHRSHHRLTHRLGSAKVDIDAINAVDAVWQSIFTEAQEMAK